KMFDAVRGSEAAWLISIARSRGIDRLRSRKIRYEREDEAGREISVHSAFVDHTTGVDRAIQTQEKTAVRGALAELPDPQRVALELSRRGSPWWLAVAATLFLALWGWRELGIRAARENDASQSAEIAQLREENSLLAQRNEKMSSEIVALSAEGTRTIALAGQEVAPSASAKVFLEPERRRAIVFFHALPANPGDKSYQPWIIPANQPKPVSAGVIDVTRGGNASIVIENLPLATEIKGLAVTLEQKGGVDQPTNTKFYVAGNAL